MTAEQMLGDQLVKAMEHTVSVAVSKQTPEAFRIAKHELQGMYRLLAHMNIADAKTSIAISNIQINCELVADYLEGK